MGKFTKQKDGFYRTTIQLGYGPDGKPIKKYLSAKTIKDLEKRVFNAKQDIAGGLLVTDSTTFGAYSRRWLDTYKGQRSIQTQNMYANALKKSEKLAELPIRKIVPLNIQEVINDNSEHPRTCEVILLTLKQIFKSAQENGLIGRNPCSGIELPRHIKKEKRALTEEEKQRLRSAVLQPQERLLLTILYGTGCRPAEAYALTKSDIDFKKGTVNINKSVQYDGNYVSSVAAPKTNASIRSVIVSESILRALKHLVDKMPHDNILGGNTGEILHKNQYEAIFKRILRKSGLSDSGISMYTLRHNFCVECYYNGLSLKACQKQMGHKDYKMILEVYSHLDELKENMREKMRAMCI